jgi:anti-sigma factor RsiW
MVMAVRQKARIIKLMDDEVLMPTPTPTPGCEREPTVGAYHDGELTGAAREEFERHLATCAACAAELQRVRGVSRWLEPLRRPVLSAADKDELARSAVRAAAKADEEQSDRMRVGPGRAVRWVRWMTAAAAAVFLFSVVQLFRAQHVTPGDPGAGANGGVPAVHHPATGPGEASGEVPGGTDSVQKPAGKRPPAQPDARGPGELQKD